MNYKEFTLRYGITPELDHGDWIEWVKPGRWELTSLNNIHVLPVLWQISTGLAFVIVQGTQQPKLVRVENLRLFKRSPNVAVSSPNASPSKRVPRESQAAKDLKKALALLGLDFSDK